MSRRRRAALLAGLALVLGGLAASDVARRESAMARRIGPLVEVVVARANVAAGERLRAEHLAVRRVPARYVPVDAARVPAEVAGLKPAVPLARGAFLTGAHVATVDAAAGGAVRRGERPAEVVAGAPPDLVVAGARVDVLVTRPGATELALQDVEVLAAAPAPDMAATEAGGGPRVRATLRVTLRQAVYLAAAQAFARELRLLPRAPGDRRRAGAVVVEEGLR